MAKRNRDTLKNYFKSGVRPSEQAFGDLIDSSLNRLDDGFSGSPGTGIELSPLTDNGVVLSTYRTPKDEKPVWEMAIQKESGDLQIRQCENSENPVSKLTLKNKDDEDSKTGDVVFDGTIHSPGRKGSYIADKVPADGKWHDLLGKDSDLIEGCWAFEIVAGCGGERGKGKYALLVAIAVHCYGSRPRIKKVASNFGVFGNRLCLRWVKVKDMNTCKLQMKTFFDYRDGTMIKYQISKLWDNPTFEM